MMYFPASSVRRRVEVTSLTILMVIMMLMTERGVGGTQQCDGCDCQISSPKDDDHQLGAIHSLRLVCNTGTIEWFEASGAVRLELQPFVRGDFRTCFIAEAANIHLKISQENPKIVSSSKNYRLKTQEEVRTLKMDHLVTSSSESEEICVDSSRDSNLLLYIEAVRTSETIGVPKIVFHYDVAKINPAVIADPMEECRPCSSEEILDAYCSSDFVVVGSMTSVSAPPMTSQMTSRTTSQVTLKVSQVIHQREPGYFRRQRRADRLLTGVVAAPRVCDIQTGSGQFLVTGRQRLHTLALGCVASLEDWRGLQAQAECVHG